MKRLFPSLVAAAFTVAAAVTIAAGPASAHEEISPSSVPAGRPAFLILNAANERQVAATSVTLTPPAELTLGSVSREPAGWALERAGGAATWSGGLLASGKFEQFGIELEAPDQPGAFTFRSTMRFADGRTDTHDVVLTVSQAGATRAPDTIAPAVTTTTTAPPAIADEPTVEAAPGDDGGARGRANLALGVGAAGLLLGLVAVAMAARRPPAAAAGDGTPTKEQEW